MEKLIECLKNDAGRKYLLIVHDNPDPDAIGASLGFGAVCRHFKINYDIVYAGRIHRTENKILMTKLNLEDLLTEYSEFSKNIKDYDRFVSLDCIAGGTNVSIGINREPDIILDHHGEVENAKAIVYSLLDQRYGCTSSIIVKLVEKLGIKVDTNVAIALAYGIRVDTQELLVGSDSDFEAYSYIMRKIPAEKRRILGEIENPERNERFYKLFAIAVERHIKNGTYLIIPLGLLDTADIEMVGHLINDFKKWHGFDVTVMWGHYIKTEHEGNPSCSVISIRSRSNTISAVTFGKKIFGKEYVGGDKDGAGARMPIPYEATPEPMKAGETLDDEFIARIDKEIKESGDEATE